MTATLDAPAPVWNIQAIHLGPTWERNPDWDGKDALAEFVLPERTLGWQILDWVEDNLLSDDGTPFTPTREQSRFLLHWFAVDERGRFVYRDGVLQRLKGWGKDPIAAVLSAVEFVGPCRFSHWATKDDAESFGVEPGEPVAKAHPRAWIQIAAVSLTQTRNTMTIFPGLFSKLCIARHAINIGKEVIYGYGGQRRIEAVTSSPRALEGGRPTFQIRNETQHWLSNNDGHEMAAVMERNSTKAKGGAARALSITNAYEPSEASVAQLQRETWEDEIAGLSIATGVMYDSIEAPPDAGLRPPRKRGEPEPSEAEVRAYLAAVVTAVRGDSSWLDVDSIVSSILDRRNPPSRSRRFWMNQVVASEDAWVTPAAVDAAIDPLAEQARREDASDILRAGWLVLGSEEITMMFDGSKSDDDTGLVGCRISDGYTFTLGHWRKPPGPRGKGWLVPRHEVDNRVQEAFERFNIIAFFADPSHAQDDDSGRYWDGLIDDWHRRFKDQLQIWAVRTGDRPHSIMWDMASPQRTGEFTAAAETFVEEMEAVDDMERFRPLFTIDGHPALVQHLKNARRYPNRHGVSLWKGHRESQKKVDLAVCAVGARMLRRLSLNKGLEDEKAIGGEVWW